MAQGMYNKPKTHNAYGRPIQGSTDKLTNASNSAGFSKATTEVIAAPGAKVRNKGKNEDSYHGCPVYREELGRRTWTLLHTTAAYVPENPTKLQQEQMKQFIGNLSMLYPCEECASEFRKL